MSVMYLLRRCYRTIRVMKCIDLYLKVEVDLPDDENPQKLADELCRMLLKAYAVRKAELSSRVDHNDEN